MKAPFAFRANSLEWNGRFFFGECAFEEILSAREERTALLVSVRGLVLALWGFGKVATTLGGADVGRSREKGREERS